jgi:hypothetical protein
VKRGGWVVLASGIALGALGAGLIPRAHAQDATLWTISKKIDQVSTLAQLILEKASNPVPSGLWEYRCEAIPAPLEGAAARERLNHMGRARWELASTNVEGQHVVACFKRVVVPGSDDPRGETGCAPACAGTETCFKHTCIAACDPACDRGDYCANDHRCHARDLTTLPALR